VFEFIRIKDKEDIGAWMEVARLAKISRPERFLHLLERENSTIEDGYAFALVNQNNNEIAGTAFIQKSLNDQNHSLSVHAVAIAETTQRQGLGRILIQHIEQKAKELGASQIRLFTTGAADFYTKCGFTTYGQMPSEKNKPRFFQYKNLN
tara:strand:+ start:218 stop:667 length:450 start_codon:yes stop_codon:yes gene_type:complete